MNKTLIYNALMDEFNNSVGVCALMGNLQAESNFNPMNLQNSANKKLNMTDEEYTKAVDNGTYTQADFCSDCAGYGIAQWTSSGRKRLLLAHAKTYQCSIGNLKMQVSYLIWELKNNYNYCYIAIKNAVSIRECSDIILKKFERPKNQSEMACSYRSTLGKILYEEFTGKAASIKTSHLPILKKGNKNECVAIVQGLLKTEGYYIGEVDGIFGNDTYTATLEFQKDNNLKQDGIVGVNTWGKLGVTE